MHLTSRTTILGFVGARFCGRLCSHALVTHGTVDTQRFHRGGVDEEATPVFNALVQMGEQVMFTDGDGKVSFPCIEGLL